MTVELTLTRGPQGGAIFSGEKGKIEVNRNKFTTNPKDLIKDLPPKEEVDKWRDEVALWQARYHMENWLACIKTREKPVADVEIGHRSVSVCHLANITRELGRKLQWDPAKEQFVGDDAADKLLLRPRRKGYELPEVLDRSAFPRPGWTKRAWFSLCHVRGCIPRSELRHATNEDGKKRYAQDLE